MSLQSYEVFLARLGDSLNLSLKADDSAFLAIELNEGLTANLQYVTETDSVYIFFELAEIKPQVLSTAAVRLLQANLFGLKTGGGTLALQEDSNIAVFSYQGYLALGADRLVQIFINTARYAEYWQQEILRMNEEAVSEHLRPFEGLAV